ncbi:MAG: hypothetical protein J6W44_04925, partial [Oscillospiraceae bacterium]|nr:hypothetical protein [Oscillospiraceae bacterium]
ISLFTYLAAYGLYKWADDPEDYGNNDGYVTLYELYQFINYYEGSSQHVQMYPYGSSYKLTKVS